LTHKTHDNARQREGEKGSRGERKLKPNVKTVQTRSSAVFHCNLPELLPIPAIQFYSILFYILFYSFLFCVVAVVAIVKCEMILSNLFYSCAEVFIILKSAEQCRD